MKLTIFFSPTTTGFYDSHLLNEYENGKNLPDDIIVMTDEEVSTYYMTPPPEGMKLGAMAGHPAWVSLQPPTPEELIAQAKSIRQQLLSAANDVTSDWRTELTLGIISDEDKEKLIEWMSYIQAVKAVDVSTASDISWPVQPEAPAN